MENKKDAATQTFFPELLDNQSGLFVGKQSQLCQALNLEVPKKISEMKFKAIDEFQDWNQFLHAVQEFKQKEIFYECAYTKEKLGSVIVEDDQSVPQSAVTKVADDLIEEFEMKVPTSKKEQSRQIPSKDDLIDLQQPINYFKNQAHSVKSIRIGLSKKFKAVTHVSNREYSEKKKDRVGKTI